MKPICEPAGSGIKAIFNDFYAGLDRLIIDYSQMEKGKEKGDLKRDLLLIKKEIDKQIIKMEILSQRKE